MRIIFVLNGRVQMIKRYLIENLINWWNNNLSIHIMKERNSSRRTVLNCRFHSTKKTTIICYLHQESMKYAYLVEKVGNYIHFYMQIWKFI